MFPESQSAGVFPLIFFSESGLSPDAVFTECLVSGEKDTAVLFLAVFFSEENASAEKETALEVKETGRSVSLPAGLLERYTFF